ncbi:hypothetical protein CCACVL1_22936, partial [Corchorus capsularis]
ETRQRVATILAIGTANPSNCFRQFDSAASLDSHQDLHLPPLNPTQASSLSLEADSGFRFSFFGSLLLLQELTASFTPALIIDAATSRLHHRTPWESLKIPPLTL